MTSPRSPSAFTSFKRIAWAIPVSVLASSVGDVGEEAQLARAFHGGGELGLVAAASARDARRADLPLVADGSPQRPQVLVVDGVDLVPAERAGLAAPASGRPLGAPTAPVPGRGSSTLLRQFSAPAYSLRRGQNGMSSSDPPAPTGACSKSPVSAGTSLWGVKRPPFSAASREPRNWTESAMISTDCRLLPCWSCHSRHSRRPSTATGRPFWRYWAQFSPCAPQTVTSK